MSDRKPIFCIGVPGSDSDIERLRKTEDVGLISLKDDYHVIFYRSSEGFIFNCFNADKMPEAEIETIKNLLNV